LKYRLPFRTPSPAFHDVIHWREHQGIKRSNFGGAAIRSTDKVTSLLKARLLEMSMARVSTTRKDHSRRVPQIFIASALFAPADSDDHASFCDRFALNGSIEFSFISIVDRGVLIATATALSAYHRRKRYSVRAKPSAASNPHRPLLDETRLRPRGAVWRS